MERMSEHTGLNSSYQLHITADCTNKGKKGSKTKGSRHTEADRCPYVLDIAKSGYLFHSFSGGMMNYRLERLSLRLNIKTVSPGMGISGPETFLSL